MPISAAESKALFIELDDTPSKDNPAADGDGMRFAAVFLMALVSSTTAVSSLDAPQTRIALHETVAKAPHMLVAFTRGEETVAGIVLVP